MFAPLEARAAELERRLEDADAAMRASYGIKDEDEEILAALDGGGGGVVLFDGAPRLMPTTTTTRTTLRLGAV